MVSCSKLGISFTFKMNDHNFSVYHLSKIYSKLTAPNDNGCRLWQGAVKQTGYGKVKIRFPHAEAYTTLNVHRLMYMLVHQTYNLPQSLVVSHLCHIKLCCTPGHLSLETQAVNNRRKTCTQLIPKTCIGHGEYASCIFLN